MIRQACSFTLAVIITQEKNPKENGSTRSSDDQIRKADSVVSKMTKAERPAPKNIGNKTELIHSIGRGKAILEF